MFNIFGPLSRIETPALKPLWKTKTKTTETPVETNESKFSKSDIDQMKMLKNELKKLRCWHTGYRAGGRKDHIPGEHSLRLAIMFFEEKLREK